MIDRRLKPRTTAASLQAPHSPGPPWRAQPDAPPPAALTRLVCPRCPQIATGHPESSSTENCSYPCPPNDRQAVEPEDDRGFVPGSALLGPTVARTAQRTRHGPGPRAGIATDGK